MADTETSTNATITPERLQAKYEDLRLHFERLASALGALSRSIESDDPGVASDVRIPTHRDRPFREGCDR